VASRYEDKMPLALDDPKWEKLTTAYGHSCGDLLHWLEQAYSSGMSRELIGEIVNEIQHQGGTSEAMYAVAPHLIALAERASAVPAWELVVHAGLIHAASQIEGSVLCPDDLAEEFSSLRPIGIRLLCRTLDASGDFNEYKYRVAALAGFMGYGKFGLAVEGFDMFEGALYHESIEDPRFQSLVGSLNRRGAEGSQANWVRRWDVAMGDDPLGGDKSRSANHSGIPNS